MIKSLKRSISFDYHPKLIKNMADATAGGAFASNIVIPSITAFILYDWIPHRVISVWLFLQFILFITRIFISKKLLYLLQQPDAQERVKRYFIEYISATLLTALMYILIVWLMYIHAPPEITIILVMTVIVLMAAGSISTLGSVIILFILFVSLTIVPIILFALFHGGETFFIFALILSVYLLFHMLLGYRQYIVLRNSLSLEETFETIYEKSSDGIVLVKENRFLDCNEAAVKMFGYEMKNEFLKMHISQHMPKYQPDGSLSTVKMLKMLKISQKEGTNTLEWLHTRSNGIYFWTEIVLTKITLNGKEVVHGVWRDIDDRKKLEIAKESAGREIEELNKVLESRVNEEVEKNREKDQHLMHQSRFAQMGEMISMIAHQWRQPLAAISATSATIELKASMNRLDSDTAQQKAQDISNFSQHLSKTIDDFRDFFKPRKEKVETSYGELIESALIIIAVSIKNKNIKLIQELEFNEKFLTYPSELKQVILNLIKNAEDALIDNKIEDPYIKIATYREKERHILEISDNARGVPKEIMESIFDPYFSTKTQKDGTGLGLYMSKMIIEEHCGGELSVVNGEDGAIFTITIDCSSLGQP
ncbi:MAG: ATP-binding protein [Campylobacterota bacterium]|nr:ATP-binding protein [Campylobacterota bacterium]